MHLGEIYLEIFKMIILQILLQVSAIVSCFPISAFCCPALRCSSCFGSDRHKYLGCFITKLHCYRLQID